MGTSSIEWTESAAQWIEDNMVSWLATALDFRGAAIRGVRTTVLGPS